MLDYIGGNPNAPTNPWSGLFKTIVVLRIGTGVLLSRHAWSGAQGAYDFVWKEKAWDWARLFVEAGVPYPQFTAPAVAVLLLAISVSFCLGFLTRLFALALMPIVGLFLFYAGEKGSVHSETAWLYLLVDFTLLLFGSGTISFDKLFHIGESWADRPKKKKNAW
jgi:uncharacterized membrane protein YphA (DoxX/SURF4 family)